MVMEKLSYKLEVFEGPMDLLLHLITKHKLNIYDIPIIELVEQYTAYIRRMKEADMEVASEFLEMAARLVYIKTVSLLPSDPQAQELKQELTGELLEYRDCKLMAQKLSEQTDGFLRFTREAEEFPIDYTYSRLHEPEELYRAYLAAAGRGRRFIPPPAEAFSGIVSHKIVSVGSRIFFILKNLIRGARRTFLDFYTSATSRSEMVATFLAMLELVKDKKIEIDGSGDSAQVVLIRKGEMHSERETAHGGG